MTFSRNHDYIRNIISLPERSKILAFEGCYICETPKNIILSLENVSISYGTFEAVRNVFCNFKRGDIITILTSKKIKIAIGIRAYDVSDAKKIIGKNSKEIKNILGYEGRDEIVHKDDLVKVAL